MSFEDDLMNDFDSSDDNEEFNVEETDDIGEGTGAAGEQEKGVDDEDVTGSLESQLDEIINSPLSVSDKLSSLDIEEMVDPSQYLKVQKLSKLIYKKLEKFDTQESDYLRLISYSDYENEEHVFLLQINKLISLIDIEMSILFSFVKFKYKVVFPELDTIITSPNDFIKIIQLVKQDLIGVQDKEQELKTFLTGDKVLVLIMSGLSNVTKQFKLKDEEFNMIVRTCEQYHKLGDLLADLSKFIQEKLVKFTPNLSNLIGPVTSAQLLIHSGSLNQLSVIPSCNLASVGVKELSSINKKINSNVQMGYLYHNDLIKYLPPTILKSALRILSGKVILAARIDLSKSSPDGSLGIQYKQEVQDKINKLLTPPDATGTKALPKPSDYKSKKRGGKRLRKMKEKLQSSSLSKAQNQLQFGQVEDTYLDTFGNEVGLGMTRDPNIKVNTNTKATVSKTMKARLENDTNEKKRHLDSIFDEDFASIFKKSKSDTNTDTKPQTSTNKWINGSMTHP